MGPHDNWELYAADKTFVKLKVVREYIMHYVDKGILIEKNDKNPSYPYDDIDMAAQAAAIEIRDMYEKGSNGENNIEYGITIYGKKDNTGKEHYYLTKMRQGNKMCPERGCGKCRLKNCKCGDPCNCLPLSRNPDELSVRIERKTHKSNNADGYEVRGFVHSHPPLKYTKPTKYQQIFSPDDLAEALGINPPNTAIPFYLVVKYPKDWTLLKFMHPQGNTYNVDTFYEQIRNKIIDGIKKNELEPVKYQQIVNAMIKYIDGGEINNINKQQLIHAVERSVHKDQINDTVKEALVRLRQVLMLRGEENTWSTHYAKSLLLCMKCVVTISIGNEIKKVAWGPYESSKNITENNKKLNESGCGRDICSMATNSGCFCTQYYAWEILLGIQYQ